MRSKCLPDVCAYIYILVRVETYWTIFLTYCIQRTPGAMSYLSPFAPFVTTLGRSRFVPCADCLLITRFPTIRRLECHLVRVLTFRHNELFPVRGWCYQQQPQLWRRQQQNRDDYNNDIQFHFSILPILEICTIRYN